MCNPSLWGLSVSVLASATASFFRPVTPTVTAHNFDSLLEETRLRPALRGRRAASEEAELLEPLLGFLAESLPRQTNLPTALLDNSSELSVTFEELAQITSRRTIAFNLSFYYAYALLVRYARALETNTVSADDHRRVIIDTAIRRVSITADQAALRHCLSVLEKRDTLLHDQAQIRRFNEIVARKQAAHNREMEFARIIDQVQTVAQKKASLSAIRAMVEQAEDNLFEIDEKLDKISDMSSLEGELFDPFTDFLASEVSKLSGISKLPYLHF